MPTDSSAILWALAYLAAKHTLSDFFLQTPYQYLNKGIYGHPGGLIHAGIQSALTLPVYLLLPPATVAMGLLVPACEFAVHYHVDWAKEQIVARCGWTVEDAGFWRALGVDQLAHALTYVAIVAVLLA